jgi:hypothetical protein
MTAMAGTGQRVLHGYRAVGVRLRAPAGGT